MELKLMLSSEALGESKLQDMTRDLCRTLNRQPDISAKIPEGMPLPGEKGDPITVGTILLALISSGAAVAMFDTLKAYFQRNKNLAVKIVSANGETTEITAQNLNKDQCDKLIRKISGE
jgi:hypothetical protein